MCHGLSEWLLFFFYLLGFSLATSTYLSFTGSDQKVGFKPGVVISPSPVHQLPMVVTRPHTPCDFLIFQIISSPCASSFSFIVHSPAVCKFFTTVSPCRLDPEIWIPIVSPACPAAHHLFYLYNLRLEKHSPFLTSWPLTWLASLSLKLPLLHVSAHFSLCSA